MAPRKKPRTEGKAAGAAPAKEKQPRRQRQRQRQPALPAAQEAQEPAVRLLDLHDGILQNIVRRLGFDRRTVMVVCKRLRDLAVGAVHSHQLAGQSVQDAIEAAQEGDTVHLLPGFYKEALLIKKRLHLTCDGAVRILSPARFAVMCASAGCLLENVTLKSHQIDESVYFLVEFGPACSHITMRGCEVLQGSYGPNTRLTLERCTLHVGMSLMAGRLEMSDCTVKCSGDSLFTYAGTELVMQRCTFADFTDAVRLEGAALLRDCSFWAYERGPVLIVADPMVPPEEQAEVANARLLHVEEQPPDYCWAALPFPGIPGVAATGARASEEQRAAAERGEVVPGHVLVWGGTAFESRSNEGITAQQEEVRREARALMLGMHQGAEAADGVDPDEVSIGNSVEDPEPLEDEDFSGESDDDWDSGSDLGGAYMGPGDQVIDMLSDSDAEFSGSEDGDLDLDLLSSESGTTSDSESSSDEDSGGDAGARGARRRDGGGGGGGRRRGPPPPSDDDDDSSSSGGTGGLQGRAVRRRRRRRSGGGSDDTTTSSEDE
ncbi:hypothetical protein C2E20_8525 [Micractinium conductrix]|uniref:Uncharacterized protein n=1 Tax=Micractinium conductrix TaxID=554055 RepID=A0A2P6V1A7_9CHLO|nr:hypothetical protein C2E20_8525 [Micractinium conductrix]|eukprot:PSC67871.1 hypothetical protein C2E20_8525 [Micractinium conductrix]